jgi:hypothetical protein
MGGCTRKWACADDYYLDEYQCVDKNVQRKYVDYSCGTYGVCSSSVRWVNQIECQYGCTNGACNPIPSSAPCEGPIDENAILYNGDNLNLTLTDSNSNVLVDYNTSRKCEWYCKPGYYLGRGIDSNKCLKISNCSNSCPVFTEGYVFVNAQTNPTFNGTYTHNNTFANGFRIFVKNDGKTVSYDCASPPCLWCFSAGVGCTYFSQNDLVNDNNLNKLLWQIYAGPTSLVYEGNTIPVYQPVNAVICADINNYFSCEDTNNDGCYELSQKTNCGSVQCGYDHTYGECQNTCEVNSCNTCIPFCQCESDWYNRDGNILNGCESDKLFSCEGMIDGNALIYVGDDVGLIASDNNGNVLADLNTSKKCEWYCKTGYHKGSGVDSNKCIQNVCTGSTFNHASMYLGDDFNLLSDTANTLVDSNTSTKCEWGCDSLSGYFRVGNQCGVSETCNGFDDDLDGTIDEGGVCACIGSIGGGTDNKDANSNAIFGKLNWSYDSIYPYDFCSWRCITGYELSAGEICTKIIYPWGDINSIISFEANSLDGNILVSIVCSKPLKVDLNIFESKDYSVNYVLIPPMVDCNTQKNTYSLTPSTGLIDKQIYVVRSSIIAYANPCVNCTREAFIYYEKATQNTSIPDNSIVLVLILLVFLCFFVSRKRV